MKTELKKTRQYEKLAELSVIGKLYKPKDNSWQLNLSNQNSHGKIKSDSLAGYYNTEAQITTIITEPFDVNIIWNNSNRVKQFVIVNDRKGESHLTLWDEKCVI